MNIETLTILAIYFAVLLVVLGFLVIFYLHIKNFKNFIPHIVPVFRALLIIIGLISIFITFKIITTTHTEFTETDFDISKNVRIDY